MPAPSWSVARGIKEPKLLLAARNRSTDKSAAAIGQGMTTQCRYGRSGDRENLPVLPTTAGCAHQETGELINDFTSRALTSGVIADRPELLRQTPEPPDLQLFERSALTSRRSGNIPQTSL